MSSMQSRTARLEAALTEAFSPTLLRVVDDSARHAGHAGAQPGGETHYNVLLVSRGVSRHEHGWRGRARCTQHWRPSSPAGCMRCR